MWTRTHDRHRPGQNLQELRELVEGGSPQERAERRHARVVLLGLNDLVTILADREGENLEHPNLFPVEAVAPLAEKDRAWRAETDCDPDQRHRHRDDQEDERG